MTNFAEKYKDFCKKIIKNLKKKIHITLQGIEPRPQGATKIKGTQTVLAVRDGNDI